jgi:chorismate dehydratase
MTIRLGRIGYVNMAPVFFRLDAEVDEVVGVPTELNRQLVAGELDVAPISSIEYARHADTLRLLPRLCVSSEGAVESIQLISKTPLEKIRTVAVTPESATSVVLTKVLFPDAEQVPLGEEAEAKLLIGDAALKSAFEDPTPHHDLGRLWLERTGLPMVFAVWAARRDYAEQNPGLVKDVHDAFVRSRDDALAHVEDVAAAAARWEVFDGPTLATYFRTLDFSLGTRQVDGLIEFARRAALYGTVDSQVIPSFAAV